MILNIRQVLFIECSVIHIKFYSKLNVKKSESITLKSGGGYFTILNRVPAARRCVCDTSIPHQFFYYPRAFFPKIFLKSFLKLSLHSPANNLNTKQFINIKTTPKLHQKYNKNTLRISWTYTLILSYLLSFPFGSNLKTNFVFEKIPIKMFKSLTVLAFIFSPLFHLYFIKNQKLTLFTTLS